MQKSEPTYHSEGHHNAGFFQCARCCEECKELIIDEYSIVILFLLSLTRRVPLIRTTTTLVSENLRVVSSWADRVSALFFYKIARPFLKKTQACFTKQMHLFFNTNKCIFLERKSHWTERTLSSWVLVQRDKHRTVRISEPCIRMCRQSRLWPWWSVDRVWRWFCHLLRGAWLCFAFLWLFQLRVDPINP